MSPSAPEPRPGRRRRALLEVALAILLLLAGVLALALLRPDVAPGEHARYSTPAKLLVATLLGGGHLTLHHGLYRALAAGFLWRLRGVIGVLVVVAGLGSFALGAVLVGAMLSADVTYTEPGRDHDWD